MGEAGGNASHAVRDKPAIDPDIFTTGAIEGTGAMDKARHMAKETTLEDRGSAAPYHHPSERPIGTVEVRFIQKDVFPIFAGGDKTPGQVIDQYIQDVQMDVASITVRFETD